MKTEIPTFLTEILKKKRERVEKYNEFNSLSDLKENAQKARKTVVPHRFINSLRNPAQINIIAEFKRKSPSKGSIMENADPRKVASLYLDGGAAAMSVLTEQDFFGGSFEDLKTVVETVGTNIPVLCKDFIIEESQIYQAAATGASAILLIIAAIPENEKLEYLRKIIEEELQMDALIEVHTEEEMLRAIEIGAHLIGINNRDLQSFEVKIETSIQLQKMAPADAVLVSESGLRSRSEINYLRTLGFDAFLIGETLMRADEPENLLRQLVYEN